MTDNGVGWVASLWEIKQGHRLSHSRWMEFIDSRDAAWLADQDREVVGAAADLAMSQNESGHLILREWTAAVRHSVALRHEIMYQEDWNQQIVMPPPTPLGEPWDERSR